MIRNPERYQKRKLERLQRRKRPSTVNEFHSKFTRERTGYQRSDKAFVVIHHHRNTQQNSVDHFDK